ncbi:hypothetical protein Lser_V15G25708 [Lactuca serriola]
MVPNKQREGAIVPEEMKGSNEQEQGEGQVGVDQSMSSFKNFLWHGGSAYDAWFSCVSNQAAQVLLNSHTLSLNWVCFQESSLKSFMDSLEAGLLISSVFSMSSIEPKTRKRMSTSKNHAIQFLECGMGFDFKQIVCEQIRKERI